MGYTCVAKLHKRALSVEYQPLILVKDFNMTCIKQNEGNKEITITCTADRIYPQVKCYFKLGSENLLSDESSISYHHVIVNEDPVYFTSSCSTRIESLAIDDCQHNVTVYMYPDLNSSVDSKDFSNRQTISFL
uniref:Uncharacterized protein n=1 Tax=Biomphalaria glabrata TaxID=6526 RepID=A0A2C9LZV6_BIOGL